MAQITFKERVKNTAISEAKNYKKNYVDYEYLVCSSAFREKDYYIIDAKEDNYQHLIGVNALIKPQEFFEKCYNGTLQETDFNFIKSGQNERSVKGSVRRKITVLSNMMNLFYNHIKVEETFIKNQIRCSFATADNKCTLGFIDATKSRPKSLIKGNELDTNKMRDVSLLLRKEIGKEKFDEIIIGNSEILMNYYEKIKAHIDNSLINLNSKNEIIEYDNINCKSIELVKEDNRGVNIKPKEIEGQPPEVAYGIINKEVVEEVENTITKIT